MRLESVEANENLTGQEQFNYPSKRLSFNSSLAANRMFLRNQNQSFLIENDSSVIFKNAPGSLKFNSSPTLKQYLKQINPQTHENIDNSSTYISNIKNDDHIFTNNNGLTVINNSSQVTIEKNSDYYFKPELLNAEHYDNGENYSQKIVVAKRQPNQTDDAQRMISNNSSVTDEEIFYEASPVFKNISNISDQSKRFEEFEFEELNEFYRDIAPQFDDNGNILPVPKYYPTLLCESFFPVVEVEVVPHMIKPLVDNNTPLDLRLLRNTPQFIRFAAPFCNVPEFSPEVHDDETSLLNILTDETNILDNDGDSKLNKGRVLNYLKSIFKFSMSTEEYDKKYPWAKYVHYDSADNDDYEVSSIDEIIKDYDLDDFYTYIH